MMKITKKDLEIQKTDSWYNEATVSLLIEIRDLLNKQVKMEEYVYEKLKEND